MRTFLVLYKKRKYFTKASHPQLEAVKKKFSLDVNISCVMQETKIFHQVPPQLQCYSIASSLQKFTPFNQIVEYLRKKFSLDANISCVMEETKIFHQGRPPSTGRFKEEILFTCEHILCYARYENISTRPPPVNWKI